MPEPVEPAPDRIGEVKPGMSREAVEALVGEPDEIVGFPNLTYHALYGSWTIAYSKEHTVIEAYDRDAPFEELGDPPAGGK